MAKKGLIAFLIVFTFLLAGVLVIGGLKGFIGSAVLDKADSKGGLIEGTGGYSMTNSAGSVFSSESTTYTRKDGLISVDEAGNPYPPQSALVLEKPKTYGYIVQFKEEPVVVKEAGLKILGAKEIGISAQAEINRHVAAIEQTHARAKSDIANILGVAQAGIAAQTSTTAKKLPKIKEYKVAFNGLALNVSKDVAEKIRELPYVKEVYEDKEVHALLYDSVPLIQEGISAGQLDEDGNDCTLSGKVCLTGEGVTIAVIDTGVDYTHGDLGSCTESQFLAGDCSKVVGGWDFVNNDNNPMDDMGHGTHVAATAAGNGTLKGVAPGAKLVAYKVLDSGGSGSWSDVIAAIERTVDPNQDFDTSDHYDIISMSLGGGGNPDDAISQAVDNAVDAGVVAVIAAGNSGPGEETIGSPGTARKAITVGATYKKDYPEGTRWDSSPVVDQIVSFSSRGPVIWTDEEGNEKALVKPDILAPGAIICAAQWDDAWADYECYDSEHVEISGTSMATPHVSGAVALLKQRHPDWTPNEIKAALKGTAIDLGYSIIDQGAGRVNVSALVSLDERPLIAKIITSGKFVGTNLEINGTAKGEGFENYRLYYSQNFDSNWIEICSSNEQRENSLLCNWNAEDLDEGTYSLKLDVIGNNRVYSEYGLIEIKNTEITSPIDLMEYDPWYDTGKVIWRSDEPIEIYGTASGKNFESYSLEWCDENYLCSQEGLDYLGNVKVENGLLGIWNPSESIKSGFYELRLTNRYNNKEFYDPIKIYIETDLLEGWPRGGSLEGEGGWALAFMDQPTIADINGDGKNNLITAYGQVADVVDEFGNSLPGWPVEINTRYSEQQKANMQYGPAVGDLTGDGFNEIVVGDNAGYIHVFNKTGGYLFEPKRFGSVIGTPTLADINNDGNLEIIWSDRGSFLYVIDNKGDLLEGFPIYLEPSEGYPDFGGSYGSVSVADLNNDENLELIVESSSCIRDLEGGCSPVNGKSRIWVLDNQGDILEGWPKEENYLIDKNIVIVDINKDGNKEIIFGTLNGSVFALNYTGENIENWPISIYNLPEGSPDWAEDVIQISGVSVGDINLDGNIEVVFAGTTIFEDTLWGVWSLDCLFVYNNLGQSVDGFPVCGDGINFKSGFGGIPIIANIDSDPEMEIIAPFGGGWYVNGLAGLYAMNHDGSIVDGFPKYLDDSPFGNVVPVGDLNNDGTNELIVGTWKGTTFVYDLIGMSGNDDWPQFQHDSQHTGCYDCLEIKSFVGTLSYLSNWKIDVENNISIILNNRLEESKSINYSLSYSKCEFENRFDCEYIEIHSGNKILSPEESFTDKKSLSFSELGGYVLKLNITGDENLVRYYRLNIIEFYSDLFGWISYQSPVVVNKRTNITAYIYNEGNEKTENASYSLYYQKGACVYNWNECDNLELIKHKEFELDKAGYLDEKVEFSFNEEGYYTLVLILNATNEANLENNVYISWVNVKMDAPDLTGWLSYQEPVVVNKRTSITAYISNEGSQTALNVNASLFYKFGEEDYALINSTYIGSLAAQDSIESIFNWTPINTGYYELMLVLNTTSDDGDWDNNINYDWVNVKMDAPDLTGYFYISGRVLVNQTKDIWIDVSNIGAQTANNVNVSLYDDEMLLNSSFINQLEADEYESFSYDWTPTILGEHILRLLVNASEDGDWANNIYSRTVSVYKSINATFNITNHWGEFVERYIITEDLEKLITNLTIIMVPDIASDMWLAYINETDDIVIGTQFIESNVSSTMNAISEYYPQVSNKYAVFANRVSWNYNHSEFYFRYGNISKLLNKTENLTVFACTGWDFSSKECTSSWANANDVDVKIWGKNIEASATADKAEAFAIGPGEEVIPAPRGGGGGGGGAPIPERYTLETVKEFEEHKEIALSLSKNAEISVTVTTSVSTESHKIVISDINKALGIVTLTISSTPFNVILRIGETREVDINKDGFVDLSIILKSITGDKADLVFKKLATPISVPTCFDGIKNQGEEGIDCGGPCKSCGVGPGPAPPEEVVQKNYNWWISAAILVVLIGIAVYYYRKYARRNKIIALENEIRERLARIKDLLEIGNFAAVEVSYMKVRELYERLPADKQEKWLEQIMLAYNEIVEKMNR